MEVRLWSGQVWNPVKRVARHRSKDIAILELAKALGTSGTLNLPTSCNSFQDAVSLCSKERKASDQNLSLESAAFRCAERGCFSEALDLAPGASGCPLFETTSRQLIAIGVSSIKNGSRVVCLERALVDGLAAELIR